MDQMTYLAFCRNELSRSKRWRSSGSHDYDEDWKRYVDLYQGRHYDAKNNVDQLTINMIFSTINTMGPAVAINNPKFAVNARNPMSAPQAIITEEVLNYLWRTHGYQRDFRLAVLDWMIVGHGWLKAGYKATKAPETKKTDGPIPSESETDDGVDEGVDDREDIPGNVESEMNVAIDDDRPFLERISPFDMYVDPDARHPKEIRWIAQRTWRAVQDVHVDSRYSPTARKKVSASTYSRWDSDESDARRSDEKPDGGAVSYAEIIEFYDIKRNKVCTFAVNAEDVGPRGAGFLIKPQKIPYTFGHPFVMLRNYEIPDHFYTIGDVAQIESLQLELNETRNQMLNYRKKFRRAWLYSKDRFDNLGIQALESDEDNVMIPVIGDNDPSSAISPVPPSITPPEFFDQSAMITNDLDRVSGVNDYQRGAQSAIKRTATEAAMIQDASNARAQDRLAKVEGILSEVAERIVQLMQQFVTGEQVARIVTMPVKGWINYDSDRIQGQFDYEVVGGSTEPQNETFRRQMAMQIVDASMPFMEAGIVNMPALYQKLLRDGFGIKDAERFVQAPPPPPGPPEGGAPPGGPPPPGMEGAPPPGWDQLPPEGAPPPMPEQLTPEMFAAMTGGGMPPPPPEAMPPEMMPPV